MFQPAPGEHLTVTVRLDAAGTVTGVARDAVMGAEVVNVCPTVLPPLHWQGDINCNFYGGSYSVPNLGPYQWKLAFPVYDGQHAWVWSGDAANRASATPVQVVAGQTVTLDAALPATGTISGTVTGPAGSCLQCTQIFAIDADSGDHAAVQAAVATDGTFTIQGLNTQNVWLYYNFGTGLIKHPTPVRTTAGGAVTGIVIARS